MKKILSIFLLALTLQACSSSKKKSDPVLSRYIGKKIALVEVRAEKTARTITEVALVNQIAKRGTFILLPKQDYDEARAKVGVDTTDPNEIARAMGADYSLRIVVDEFDAKETTGYSKEKVYDDQLAKERGKAGGNTERLFKVKALDGKVHASLAFTDLKTGEVKSAELSETDRVVKEGKTEAAHLPPKMGFLSGLMEKGFQHFFDRFE